MCLQQYCFGNSSQHSALVRGKSLAKAAAGTPALGTIERRQAGHGTLLPCGSSMLRLYRELRCSKCQARREKALTSSARHNLDNPSKQVGACVGEQEPKSKLHQQPVVIPTRIQCESLSDSDDADHTEAAVTSKIRRLQRHVTRIQVAKSQRDGMLDATRCVKSKREWINISHNSLICCSCSCR